MVQVLDPFIVFCQVLFQVLYHSWIIYHCPILYHRQVYHRQVYHRQACHPHPECLFSGINGVNAARGIAFAVTHDHLKLSCFLKIVLNSNRKNARVRLYS